MAKLDIYFDEDIRRGIIYGVRMAMANVADDRVLLGILKFAKAYTGFHGLSWEHVARCIARETEQDETLLESVL